MSRGRGWNEENLSENPAVAHLERLGWTYVRPEVLDEDRESLKQVVLVPRLAAAIKKLNPWISDDNVHKAVRAITGLQVTSLIEASEKLHTTLTYGIALEQDLGDGKKSHPVRYFDFENAAANECVVTRQFKVHGTKKNIRTDVMLFVNGIPMGINRVQESDPRRRLEARSRRSILTLPRDGRPLPGAWYAEALRDHPSLGCDVRAGRRVRDGAHAVPILRGVEDAAPAHAR